MSWNMGVLGFLCSCSPHLFVRCNRYLSYRRISRFQAGDKVARHHFGNLASHRMRYCSRGFGRLRMLGDSMHSLRIVHLGSPHLSGRHN